MRQNKEKCVREDHIAVYPSLQKLLQVSKGDVELVVKED
jgi:hypothetical protein